MRSMATCLVTCAAIVVQARISTIRIVSERHQASNFIENTLRRTSGLPVEPSLCLHKHKFQTRVHEELLRGPRPTRNRTLWSVCSPTSTNDTAVVNAHFPCHSIVIGSFSPAAQPRSRIRHPCRRRLPQNLRMAALSCKADLSKSIP